MVRSKRLRKEERRLKNAVKNISTSTKISLKMVYLLIFVLIVFSGLVGFLLHNNLISIIMIVGTFMLVNDIIIYNKKRDLKTIESDLSYLATKISNHLERSNDVLAAINDNRKKTPNKKLSETLDIIVTEVNVVNYTLVEALDRQINSIDSRLWRDFIKVLKACSVDSEMRHALKSLTIEMDEIKSNQNLYDMHRQLAWREYFNAVLMSIFLFLVIGISMKEIGSHIFSSLIGTTTFSLYICSIYATMIYNLKKYRPLSEVGRRRKK